eukprot:6926066-Prymnesium_polylepis.1
MLRLGRVCGAAATGRGGVARAACRASLPAWQQVCGAWMRPWRERAVRRAAAQPVAAAGAHGRADERSRRRRTNGVAVT